MDNCGNSCQSGCQGLFGSENTWLVIALIIIVFVLLNGEHDRY